MSQLEWELRAASWGTAGLIGAAYYGPHYSLTGIDPVLLYIGGAGVIIGVSTMGAAYYRLWWFVDDGTMTTRAAVKFTTGCVLLWYLHHLLPPSPDDWVTDLMCYWLIITGLVRFMISVGTLRHLIEYLTPRPKASKVYGDVDFSKGLKKK